MMGIRKTVGRGSASPGLVAGVLGVVGLAIVGLDLFGFAARQGQIEGADVRFWRSVLDLGLEPVMRYSAGLLVLCAVLTARAGILIRGYTAHWLTLSALLIALAATKLWALYSFALDFIRALDERIGLPLTVPTLALVGLLVLVVPYWKFLRALHPPLRNFLIASAAIYLFGFVFLEAVTEYLWNLGGSATWSYVIVSGVEEVFEMGGSTLAVYALMKHGSADREPET